MLTETGLASGLAYTGNLLPAAPVGLLGLLLLFQVTISGNRQLKSRHSKNLNLKLSSSVIMSTIFDLIN